MELIFPKPRTKLPPCLEVGGPRHQWGDPMAATDVGCMEEQTVVARLCKRCQLIQILDVVVG